VYGTQKCAYFATHTFFYSQTQSDTVSVTHMQLPSSKGLLSNTQYLHIIFHTQLIDANKISTHICTVDLTGKQNEGKWLGVAFSLPSGWPLLRLFK